MKYDSFSTDDLLVLVNIIKVLESKHFISDFFKISFRGHMGHLISLLHHSVPDYFLNI